MIAAPLERIILSKQAKDQLVYLKRTTGISQWNILCRWALCLSLKEETPPAPMEVPADSNVEMSWRVFCGPYEELMLALLKERYRSDVSNGKVDMAHYFRLHLQRGVGYLGTASSDIP